MPSLRLVAGPNGSGKTTLTKELRETYAVPLGQYLNPDDIAKHIDLPALLGETVDKALLSDESASQAGTENFLRFERGLDSRSAFFYL